MTNISDEVLKDKRIIFLWGDINEDAAKHVILSLEYLTHISKKPITLLINSDGGCVESAWAIIDWMNLLKESEIIIKTIATKACSAAGYILCFGSPGHRYATKNAMIMLHDVTLELSPNSVKKHEQQLAFETNKLDILNKQMAKVCGKNLAKYIKDVESEKWFLPEEALKYKIIDSILTQGTEHD